MKRTQRFPVNQVILEGPDLAGKTSFYNKLHRLTGYRWNIQDRSSLSMLVYAKLYKRDTFIEVERLHKELNDLNNKIVILLPPWEEITRRYVERGDELQNLISLNRIYELFEEAVEDLKLFPNVYVIRHKDTLSFADQLVKEITGDEISSPVNVAAYVNQFAAACKNLEANHINITMYDDGQFKYHNLEVLDYKPEKKYYNIIKSKLLDKLRKELAGENEYKRKEDILSRRFIYSDDTCISLAHFLFRNNILDCNFILRSSNTKDTLKYDIQFLYLLSKEVKDLLGITPLSCRIRINFGSAHIIIP
jgi:thymidylate kinase